MVHDPRSPCEEQRGGRAPRRPGRDTPGDACRWSPSRGRESRSRVSSWPITTGREALQAHRLCSRAERPGPILINGARPPVGLRGKHGAVLPEGGNLHDPLLPCDWGNRGPVPVTVYLRTRHRSATAPGGLVPVRQCPLTGRMAAPRLHLISGACAGRRRCTRRIGRGESS